MMASRSSRRKKIRRDRIYTLAGTAAVLLLIIIVITANAVSGAKKEEEAAPEKESTVQTSSTDKTSRLEYEIKYVSCNDIHKGSLILVNDSNICSLPAEEMSLTVMDEMKNDYYAVKDVTMKMETMALKNFNSMLSGFWQECSNSDIMVTEAYVTAAHQNLLYNQARENSRYESRGGYSEHQTGLAADLYIYPEGSKSYRYVPSGDYAWIRDNCTRYGFVQRYAEGKEEITGISDHTEHFRYVGIPHAWYMKENGLSLEEYLQEIKKYAYTNRTLSVSCYGKDYEIYYIKARENNGSSEIYVPVNCQYTVSGNNVDGFVITVEK